MYLRIIILVLFCLVLICCPNGPSHTTIRIQGWVVNALDESPIEGAMVSIWHQASHTGTDDESGHAHTDSNGYFYIKFTVLDCNRFRCDAWKDGFETPVLGFPEINAKVRCTEDLQTIMFKLIPE